MYPGKLLHASCLSVRFMCIRIYAVMIEILSSIWEVFLEEGIDMLDHVKKTDNARIAHYANTFAWRVTLTAYI